jgi:hypothetical protein
LGATSDTTNNLTKRTSSTASSIERAARSRHNTRAIAATSADNFAESAAGEHIIQAKSRYSQCEQQTNANNYKFFIHNRNSFLY